MLPILSKACMGITPEQKQQSEIEFDLLFTIPDLVFKFQMICLWGNLVIERFQMQDVRTIGHG